MFSGSLGRFTQINSSSPASNGQKQQKDGHSKERQLHAIYVSTSAQQGIDPKPQSLFAGLLIAGVCDGTLESLVSRWLSADGSSLETAATDSFTLLDYVRCTHYYYDLLNALERVAIGCSLRN